MTFSEEVDRILAQALHRLKRIERYVGYQLHWIMLDEEHEFLKLPVAFDLRAEARRGLAQWHKRRNAKAFE
jgi:hypothetical protein